MHIVATCFTAEIRETPISCSKINVFNAKSGYHFVKAIRFYLVSLKQVRPND